MISCCSHVANLAKWDPVRACIISCYAICVPSGERQTAINERIGRQWQNANTLQSYCWQNALKYGKYKIFTWASLCICRSLPLFHHLYVTKTSFLCVLRAVKQCSRDCTGGRKDFAIYNSVLGTNAALLFCKSLSLAIIYSIPGKFAERACSRADLKLSVLLKDISANSCWWKRNN